MSSSNTPLEARPKVKVLKETSTYPILGSITLIVGAIVLSFVDLMFINDVIGKILDMDSSESPIIAFALAMIGIGIMAHEGMRSAYHTKGVWLSIAHYSLWVLLGLSLVAVRVFSASILQLDPATSSEQLIEISGLIMRQVDLVIAPLMLLMYLATGIMVKDGVKNLISSPDFAAWIQERREGKRSRRAQEQADAEEAKSQRLKQMSEMEQIAKEAAADRAELKSQGALNQEYSAALSDYNKILAEIKRDFQTIASNVGYVKNLDAKEIEFNQQVKPGLMRIVDGSIDNVRNSTALSVHRKYSVDIKGLRNEIELHDSNKTSR